MTSENVKKQRLLKKGILNLTYNHGILFEKSKEPDKFRASKTRKMLEKYPKLKAQ